MKSLYNSILGSMEDSLDKGLDDANKIMNSFKERYIKIISLAANMADKEINKFRDIVNDLTKNEKYILCYIPQRIRDNLTVLSKRKLSKPDFNGFFPGVKEYEFQCSMEYLAIELADTNMNNMVIDAKNKPGTIVKGNKFNVIYLGNATIIFGDHLIYTIIKSNLYTRVIARFTDSTNNKLAQLLNV